MVRILAQPAQRADVELQARRGADVKTQPCHRHGTEDVAVGKREHSTIDGLAQPDELEGTGVDLGGRLPAWRAVSVQLPAGMLLVNLRGGDALVPAVIDLAQQRRQLRTRESGDLSRAYGALKRAGQHQVEGQSPQPLA